MLAEYIRFITERELIRQRRVRGYDAPWTDDPILRSGYFCNVRREDDKVTRWITDNWVLPNANDPDLWFAMTVARNINLPETLQEIGYPVPWDPERFVNIAANRKEMGRRIYSGAYMIRASRTNGELKARYQADKQFTPAWNARERLRPLEGDTLDTYFNVLIPEHGYGHFLAGQVIADLKQVGALKQASDWFTWCTPGPGSQQGLNALVGKDLKIQWKPNEFRRAITELQDYVNSRWDLTVPLCAQNIQNTLCEWSKYYKAKFLGIRFKRKYRNG